MRFPIVTVIVLVVLAVLLYSYANAQAKENYNKAFQLCRQSQSTVDVAQYPQAQQCIESGGCFNQCGSSCFEIKPYFDFKNFLSGQKSCIQVCKPTCMMPTIRPS